MSHDVKPEHKAKILSEALPYIKKFLVKPSLLSMVATPWSTKI